MHPIYLLNFFYESYWYTLHWFVIDHLKSPEFPCRLKALSYVALNLFPQRNNMNLNTHTKVKPRYSLIK